MAESVECGASVRDRDFSRMNGDGETFSVEFADTKDTGDKYQFPDPGHCKYTVRAWTMYLGKTHLVHHKYIQNVPNQSPCSVPSAGNAQDIYSVPGHVIAMS